MSSYLQGSGRAIAKQILSSQIRILVVAAIFIELLHIALLNNTKIDGVYQVQKLLIPEADQETGISICNCNCLIGPKVGTSPNDSIQKHEAKTGQKSNTGAIR